MIQIQLAVAFTIFATLITCRKNMVTYSLVIVYKKKNFV